MNVLRVFASADQPPGPSGSLTDATAAMVSDPLKTLEIKPHVIEALVTVYDPEIPVNIYKLGLILSRFFFRAAWMAP